MKTLYNPRSILGLFGFVMAAMLLLPLISFAAPLYRQLEFGMTGPDVSDLQTFLAKDPTIYPQGLVTGYFGNLTKAAVSNFQAKNGIAVVGRVGPITMASINEQMSGGVAIGADNKAPSISSVSASSTLSTTANISWNTDEDATGIVYYSPSFLSMMEASIMGNITIGGASIVANTDLRVPHSAVITGLNPNTTYYFVVYSRDGSGNESLTWPGTFHTSQ